MNVIYYYSVFIFSLGVVGFFFKRDLLAMMFCVCLMLMSLSVLFVSISNSFGDLTGQIQALFILVFVAVEVAAGMMLLFYLYKSKGSIYKEIVE